MRGLWVLLATVLMQASVTKPQAGDGHLQEGKT